MENHFTPKDTWFAKTQEQLCTHRSVGVEDFVEPFDTSKYAGIDHILVNNKWKNTIKNINTTKEIDIDSDHKLMWAEINIKLKKKEPNNTAETAYRFRPPTDEQIEVYNKEIMKKANETNWIEKGDKFEHFAQLIKEAARHSFDRIPAKQKKEYISKETWELMENRRQMLRANDPEKVKEISKEIKKRIHGEKMRHQLEQLEEMDKDGYKWEGLKNRKRKFNPRTTKFKDKTRRKSQGERLRGESSRISG